MALVYLADTNIVSEVAKPVPNRPTVHAWRENLSSIAISSVTWHELQYGLRRLPQSKRKRGIQQFMEDILDSEIPILPFDQDAAEWMAVERIRLASMGKTSPYGDTQIASIAATNNLIMVTRNEKDFLNFEGLRVENWFR